MSGERLGFNPESRERVNLDNLLEGEALMTTAVTAFARREIGLPEARRIVADAAEKLENLR